VGMVESGAGAGRANACNWCPELRFLSSCGIVTGREGEDHCKGRDKVKEHGGGGEGLAAARCSGKGGELWGRL